MSAWDWEGRAAAAREAQEAAGRSDDVGAAAFRAALDRAWPPGFFEARERLHEGRATRKDLDLLIDFLVADPVFFRSGYIQESVLRWMKRAPLEADQAERLRAVVVDAIERRHRPYFRRYCSVARALDTPGLRDQVRERVASTDPAVRRHAESVMDALEGRGR
ncbi:hypothetical protein [Anaeromyxobacter oryzae]|uniref:Uncharacterized protein n=1 Tax=Anaeromyxobacter oryzae TaxID=2918170 RepID=A0ABM7WQ90_9BACT|nr:hypothetical protein [Anaeromyxobacter oryzae]BDG01642.1 hypothetical protein AMOR_06380 [Anaeromyxobacter oryzae]